ncbi:VOC family protein [Pareuzebyella sediminis]|uniref:VOC family protein n=1 Tax=Pareuzebyella sediminis TaxID=2607998 RepID=UPI0011EF48E7|nr:VOC family protein [Pareuzebyella sediminis]
MVIKKLKLYTPRIREQTRFYSEVLGLGIQKTSVSEFTFKIGDSLMTMIEKREAKPYHFAINIPANKAEEALNWIKSRVAVLKDGHNEIQKFEAWNAKSIYFYDKDKNIVELIARKNLNNDKEQEFESCQFLELSEIGLVTNHIEQQFDVLNKTAKMTIFDGTFERFCAIGDEKGLFICIDPSKKDWYPNGDKPFSSDFEIEFMERDIPYKAPFKKGILTFL